MKALSPPGPATGRIRVALAALLAVASVASLAAGAATLPSPGIPAIDAAGLHWWQAQRSPGLDAFFMAVTWLGSIAVLLPAAIVLAWFERHRGRAALFVPLSLATTSLLAHLVKLVVERPRPELFEPLVALPADSSFPSAHTMQATAFALALLLQPGRRPQAALVAAAAALVIVVGLSRLHLQVHYPTDVAFGAVAAVLLVAALRCLPVWRSTAS